MKNKNKGFIVPLFLAIIALLVIGGGVYIYKNKKAEAPAVVDTEVQTINQTQQTNTQNPPVTFQPSITVLSPNGGEYFTLNSSISISWKQNYNSSSSRICLLSKNVGCVYTSPLMKGVYGQNQWVIPSSVNKWICTDNRHGAPNCNLDSGYKINIITDNPSGVQGEFINDSSDNYFIINNK